VGGVYNKSLKYDGLNIGLLGIAETELKVSDIVITSDQYQTGGGVRVGDTLKSLQNRCPDVIYKNIEFPDAPHLKQYELRTDNENFYGYHVEYLLENEKIVEISIYEWIDNWSLSPNKKTAVTSKKCSAVCFQTICAKDFDAAFVISPQWMMKFQVYCRRTIFARSFFSDIVPSRQREEWTSSASGKVPGGLARLIQPGGIPSFSRRDNCCGAGSWRRCPLSFTTSLCIC
jgi:hypothetical protein